MSIVSKKQMCTLRDLNGRLLDNIDAMLGALREHVDQDTPSLNKTLLDPFAKSLLGRFELIGGRGVLERMDGAGDHVSVRFDFGSSSTNARSALVLGHYDTVWPEGSAKYRPFTIDGRRATGPGVYDMKAGLVVVEFALEALQGVGLAPPRPVEVLITSDEEVGSVTSRRLIEERARLCEYALIVEPPLANGALKTARKAIGRFVVETMGKAAHSGVDPEAGASAIVELAHQILKIQAFNHPSDGTTLNVGQVEGGTAANVIPASAKAVVDVRVWNQADADRIASELRTLSPVGAGTRVEVSGGFNRPPMERNDQTVALFERARRVGLEFGLELEEGSTGGGSDGNFTAAAGAATLDGLGVPGGGAHSVDEYILIDKLPERAALLAALLLRL
jgi:glutamate carboxypeptidase